MCLPVQSIPDPSSNGRFWPTLSLVPLGLILAAICIKTKKYQHTNIENICDQNMQALWKVTHLIHMAYVMFSWESVQALKITCSIHNSPQHLQFLVKAQKCTQPILDQTNQRLDTNNSILKGVTAFLQHKTKLLTCYPRLFCGVLHSLQKTWKQYSEICH